ncbi:MAG: gephyrin-like molybdotransferase Glp, partial [Pseudomonadota bacterium]
MKTIAQIAAELQGYDPQALAAGDVNKFLAKLVEPVTETETVGIFDALGRVLAADVVSPLNVPPHDNSAMDGYAFDGALLAGKPLLLQLAGTAFAGTAWQGTAGPGQCVKVMTGAIMPAGMDTVVPLEMALPSGDQISIPAGTVQRGDNRRLCGEDIAQGQTALRQGDRITPAALGLAASLGISTLPVVRKLRVAYFSTGDEILSVGEAPREGAVYDSNRYTVFGLLTRLGVEVIDLGVVRDDPALLEATFVRAAAEADAIITSGGVSVGEADYTKAMMKKLAGDVGGVAFWRIAMRPGRPMAVGRIAKPAIAGFSAENQAKSSSGRHAINPDSYEKRSAVLFGLPGNPVAVMVTFLAFVRPALLQMMGSKATTVPLLRARSLEPLRKKHGRTEYQRGTVSTAADGTLQV